MIKIIKPGTKKKTECPDCGCLFSYDEATDVTIADNRAFGGYQPPKKYIKCPQCKYEIILEATR